jgi:hypothetical protein
MGIQMGTAQKTKNKYYGLGKDSYHGMPSGQPQMLRQKPGFSR